MTVFTVPWKSYVARYDTEGGASTVCVDFPGGHEIAGPAGTLTGLLDLAEKVIRSVDGDREAHVTGDYVWPPTGYFASETVRLRKDGPLAQYLNVDWDDPEQIWSATLYLALRGNDWCNVVSLGLGYWRALAPALRGLLAYGEVRTAEAAAAVRLT